MHVACSPDGRLVCLSVWEEGTECIMGPAVTQTVTTTIAHQFRLKTEVEITFSLKRQIKKPFLNYK